MRVLNLVTTESPFVSQQVSSVEANGVSCSTVTVPGQFDAESGRSRSPADYARFYARVLRRSLDDFDVVHANYGLTAPAGLAQPTRPVVLSLWGSDVHGPYGWLSRACARYYDAVVVVSEELGAAIDRDCHVVPHCVDFDLFEPRSRDAARDDVGWDRDSHHVIFPYSKRRAVKDYPRAARVVDRADARVASPVELHAVTGVPHERVPAYMNAADALLLTSKHEGSPNSVKEAMACGLPVVSTDVGDVGDLLADVSPSVVARSDDALATGLASILQSGDRSNGREAIRPYDVEWMGERLTDVYRSVTS